MGDGEFLTFIRAVKRSLCMKYETRLVWKPPATKARTVSSALVRNESLVASRIVDSRP